MTSKLQVLHAALVETARLCHPRMGHKLDAEVWGKVLADSDFQSECNALIYQKTNKGLFTKSSADVPSPDDYRQLADQHIDALGRWEQWGSVKALFYSFDAEVALSGLAEGPFLSELVSDILLEDMMDQVDRGYLTL